MFVSITQVKMKTEDKTILLETLEATVERHLREVLHDFQMLPENILLRPSASGGWSVAQCLEHLNRYGKYYLPLIQKGIAAYAGSPSDTFTSSWLGSYFTSMMQPGKGKMKTFKGYSPPPSLDAYGVVAEFAQQQEMLLRCLREAHRINLNKIRIPVSIARFIRLKLGDVFQFVIMHNERHLLQAKRNLDSQENTSAGVARKVSI
jgi:hypothetical protein